MNINKFNNLAESSHTLPYNPKEMYVLLSYIISQLAAFKLSQISKCVEYMT